VALTAPSSSGTFQHPISTPSPHLPIHRARSMESHGSITRPLHHVAKMETSKFGMSSSNKTKIGKKKRRKSFPIFM